MSKSAFNDASHTFRSETLQSVLQEAITFFLQTPVHPLPPTARFIGPGVYALYYSGSFPLYAPLATLNIPSARHPIYVGKAVPKGHRTGRQVLVEAEDLRSRLLQHARNIEQAENLALQDFSCRFMILRGVEHDLIGMTEAALMRRFQPIWNSGIEGFGLHDVGKARYGQLKNMWDTLHPGRLWATRYNGPEPLIESIEQIITLTMARLSTSTDEN